MAKKIGKRRKAKRKSTQTKKKRTKRGPKKKARITRKDAAKYPGLNPKFFSRVKQEYHDIDYAHKLSEKDKEWLSSFMEEDLGARFNHSRKKIYKKKSNKKDSYDRNNSRNRDIYSIAKATGKVTDVSLEIVNNYLDEKLADESFEDRLIDQIDKKNKD